jgi:hypothetical protein
MKINVVNKYNHTPSTNYIYIGRGTALGNPFPITTKDDRDAVCNKYENYLKNLKPSMKAQLNSIVNLGREHGEVNLVCFCAPKRCHGDSIKALIESKLGET